MLRFLCTLLIKRLRLQLDIGHPKVKLLDKPNFIGQKNAFENWIEEFNGRDGKIIRDLKKSFHSSFWELLYAILYKRNNRILQAGK